MSNVTYLQMFFQIYYYCCSLNYKNYRFSHSISKRSCPEVFCKNPHLKFTQNSQQKSLLLMKWVQVFLFFFYQGFLSRTLTTHRTAGEGRGPSYSTLPLPPAGNFVKKWLQYRCFPGNFVKFLRTPILKNFCERLALHLKYDTPANNTAEAVIEYSKTATAGGRNIV